MNPATLKKILSSGLKSVIAAEPTITHYDTIVGDGDCGVGLKRGAEAVLSLLESPATEVTDDVVNAISQIVSVVENTMDGTSGAIYAIFINALAHGLRSQGQHDPSSTLHATDKVWSKALGYAVTALHKYTPAKPGDRTLVDALDPFCNALETTGDVRVAAKASQEAADGTKFLAPKLGRTVYVGGEENWFGKIPDPGAYGLAQFFAGLAEGV